MPNFGPIYCETPEVVTGVFPVEPWNAISSIVIVLFGLAASYLVVKRAPRAYELYPLCALLVVNGVGSVLWHGLRTSWALTLDFLPALIFVLAMAFLWAWRATQLWKALALLGVLIVLQFVLRLPDLGLSFLGRWAIMAGVLVAMGLWLTASTRSISREAAFTGGVALVSAIAAATFRSIDGAVCDTIPFGSHFLWHIFLSAAAYLCMRTLVTLDSARRSGRIGSAVEASGAN